MLVYRTDLVLARLLFSLMLALNKIISAVLFELAVTRVGVECWILIVRGDIDAAINL